MKISTRFTAAIHTLLCIAILKEKVTSEIIAKSTNMNPVIIRKILLQLQKFEIISTKAGIGGSYLKKKPAEITLLDVYKAVSLDEENNQSVFNFHLNPNQECPIGKRIHLLLNPCLNSAQIALENELKKTTLDDLMTIFFEDYEKTSP